MCGHDLKGYKSKIIFNLSGKQWEEERRVPVPSDGTRWLMFCWCIQIRWTPPKHVTINWSGEAIYPSIQSNWLLQHKSSQHTLQKELNLSKYAHTLHNCRVAPHRRSDGTQGSRNCSCPWFARCGYPRSRTWYCWNICNAHKRTRADFYLPSHPLWRYCSFHSFKCHFCHINAANNNRKNLFLQWKHKQDDCDYLSCDRPTRLRPSTLNNWSPAAKRPSWRTQTAQEESGVSRVSAKMQPSLWEPTTSAAPPLTTDLM